MFVDNLKPSPLRVNFSMNSRENDNITLLNFLIFSSFVVCVPYHICVK